MDLTTCGPKKLNTFANKDAATVELSMTATQVDDICTFIIEATCDAPYVHLKDDGDKSAPLAKMSFSIIEYDPSYTTVNLNAVSGSVFTSAATANAATTASSLDKTLASATILKKNTGFNNL